MSGFEIHDNGQVTEGPKQGGVRLPEFNVNWNYNGDGSVIVTLTDENNKLIQSLEHTKSKVLVETMENGKLISPVLPDHIKNYMIDIDGTIGEDIPNEEPERMATAEIYPDALETVNKWYEEGHVITFFTSRTEDHRKVTETWLKENGFKYHGLLMSKPRGGNYHWIDNHIVRATRFKGKFTDLVNESATIQVFEK